MAKLTRRQTAVIERIEENDGVLPKSIEKYFQERTLDSLCAGGKHGLIVKLTFDLIHMLESADEEATQQAFDLHGVTADQYVSIEKLEDICAAAHFFDIDKKEAEERAISANLESQTEPGGTGHKPGDKQMNVEKEVKITLMELIKLYGDVMDIRWQTITQNIDERYPDLDDAAFEAVKDEAIKKLTEARQAWMRLNCA